MTTTLGRPSTSTPGAAPSGLARAAGVGAGAALAGIGALHAAWALGSTWPLADRADFARTVVNVPESQLPSPALTLAVAGLLGGAGAVLLGRVDVWGRRVPQRLLRWGTWAVAGALAARGLAGAVDSGLFVARRSTPYARWDAAFYSPLCLALAGLCLLADRGSRRRP